MRDRQTNANLRVNGLSVGFPAARLLLAGPLARPALAASSTLCGIGPLLFNSPAGFFRLVVQDGHLYGTLVDILNQGSKVMLLSLGMTLVIATGGVDLSVGSVMAIAGALAAVLVVSAGLPFCRRAQPVPARRRAARRVEWRRSSRCSASSRSSPRSSSWSSGAASRCSSPAGRSSLSKTRRSSISATATSSACLSPSRSSPRCSPLTALLTRRTAIGLFIEAAGDNETASRFLRRARPAR